MENIKINVKNYGFGFNAGERHIDLTKKQHLIYKLKELNSNNSSTKIEILSRISSSDDFMDTLLLISTIRSMGIFNQIELILPYLPYSRQDRITKHGEPLSIKVFAELIQSQDKNIKIITADAHSDVSLALFNNIENIDISKYIKKAINDIINSVYSNPINRVNQKTLLPFTEKEIIESITFISPDAGAYKKIYKTVSKLGISDNQILTAQKQRDTNTGYLVTKPIKEDLTNKTCIILDDICDGGMTFINLAEELKKANAERIYLFVTHGIFSKGLDGLINSGIKHIYTLNTFKSNEQYKNIGSQDLKYNSNLTCFSEDRFNENYYM